MNKTSRSVWAVFSGVLAAFMLGLILLPLARFVFDQFFHLYPFTDEPKNAWRDDLIILVTAMTWFFISSIGGGVVCVLVAKANEWLVVFFSMVLVLTILLIVSNGEIITDMVKEGLMTLVMVPLGFIAGKFLGSKIKSKNNRNNENRISADNFSSPTDIE